MLHESGSHQLPAKPWHWQLSGHCGGRGGGGPVKCAQCHHHTPPEVQGVCLHSPLAQVSIPAKVGWVASSEQHDLVSNAKMNQA